MIFKNIVFLSIITFSILINTATTSAKDAPGTTDQNVIMVLDGSGSMWGQIDGVTKIEIARDVIGDMVKSWDANTSLGLVTYGHRTEGDCEDIETLIPAGAVNAESFMSTVNSINPKGKTPITAAVRQAAKSIQYQDKKATVILISDGLETCNADPCALASELEKNGVDFTTHVIGFDMSQEESAQLACLANNTGGRFLRAANALELTEALKAVAQAEPEPAPAPESMVWFEDDFEGDGLSDEWAVINPNPDTFIVENGALLMIANEEHPTGLLQNETVSNIFQLERGLPEGDWTVTMRVQPDIQTVREVIFLALYTDPENYLSGDIGLGTEFGANTVLTARKVSGGEVTEFSEPALPLLIIKGYMQDQIPRWMNYYKDNLQEVYLRIAKTGRSYVVSTKIVGALTTADGAEPQWKETQKLTSLRSPGKKIVFGSYFRPVRHKSYDIAGGESLINIDWIKIETP